MTLDTSETEADGQEAALDGRRARRQRGRLAVTTAMIDLIFEGHAPPTAEQVAERAGVSVASLFRYFDTLEELRAEATDYCFERFADLFEVPSIGTDDLNQRITAFVNSRVTQYQTMAPIARFIRARAPEISDANATLQRLRATHSDQIRWHFDEELGHRTPARRDDLVATMSILTSFESWDQFRTVHQRSPAQIRRAWSVALGRLLKECTPGK